MSGYEGYTAWADFAKRNKEAFHSKKTGEIEIGRALIARLESGHILTLAPLHTQKTVGTIRAPGNDYILPVKENQKNLRPAILQKAKNERPRYEFRLTLS